jgi:flagellar motor switch protein FliG
MKMRRVSIGICAFLTGTAALAPLARGQNNALSNNSALNNASINNAALNNVNSSNAGLNNVSGNTGNAAINALDTEDADPLNNASLDLPSNAAPSNVSQNGVSTGASNTPSNSFGGSLGNVAAPPESVPADPVPSDADPLLAPAGASSSLGTGALAPGTAELPVADSEQEAYNQQIDTKIRPRLSGDLQRYCLDYCNILSIDVSSQENFNTANADLGFEGATTSAGGGRTFQASALRAEVMVDTRFGTSNIERLQKLFAKILERYPLRIDLQWSLVTFPDSGTNVRSEAQVRADFSQQVRNQLERVAVEYCPRDCKVSNADVNIARAGVDEVQNGAAYRYLFSRDGKGALFVRGVNASIALNSLMDAERKDRIRLLMNEVLLPFGSVNLQWREIPFPRSAEEVQKDLDFERNDPWGLKRLGEALKVFREFANTKEIIRESSTTEKNNSSSLEKTAAERLSELSRSERASTESTKSESERARELQSNLEKNSSSLTSSEESGEGFWNQQNTLLVGGILLVLLIAGALGLRFVVTGKRMQQVINEGMVGIGHAPMSSVGEAGMMAGGHHAGSHAGGGVGMPMGVVASPLVAGVSGMGGMGLSEDMKRSLSLQSLRDELVQLFVTQPKVARDVFGRMIREDGIENSARLVVVFGEMMIFELLGDADLKKEIYTLAEYVHVNAPDVSVDEQLELLRTLKLKMTAGKMRLMTSRTLDMFDFLKAKSGRQIYDLINDESPRSQSIVLTQLSTEKRRTVFELFEGQAKVDLLRELSNNDVVQREYLFNVAEALKRKAMSRPSFDGESVQGIDVLLDLLERAELHDQRNLMEDLDRNNGEIARMLRTRLVTVETLPFLRDGLLLEIFLSMESHTMATFLAGTREHIRNLILSKAPPDVADNWVEGLEQIRSIDAEALRLAEMQVIAKIRSFSNQGLLSLLEVNLSLYPKSEFDGDDDSGTNASHAKRVFKISNPLVA